MYLPVDKPEKTCYHPVEKVQKTTFCFYLFSMTRNEYRSWEIMTERKCYKGHSLDINTISDSLFKTFPLPYFSLWDFNKVCLRRVPNLPDLFCGKTHPRPCEDHTLWLIMSFNTRQACTFHSAKKKKKQISTLLNYHLGKGVAGWVCPTSVLTESFFFFFNCS